MLHGIIGMIVKYVCLIRIDATNEGLLHLKLSGSFLCMSWGTLPRLSGVYGASLSVL